MTKWMLAAFGVGMVLSGARAGAETPPAVPDEPGPVEGGEKAHVEPVEAAKPIVAIETSLGVIRVELWPDKAPETVENFLKYVDDTFFDGLIFHRVIGHFMIQGGGFTPDMKQKATRSPIRNEARADAPNRRGTLAMARTMVVDSATSQFFINLVDNDSLNHRNRTPQGFGYCVFGKVVDGMSVVDAIARARTGNRGTFADVPREAVLIKSIRRIDDEARESADGEPSAR